jgi:hypothetical protein
MKDGIVLLIVGVVGIAGIFLWREHVDPFHSARYLNAPPEPRPESAPSLPAAKPNNRPPKPAPIVEAPTAVVEAAPLRVEPPAAPAPPAPPAVPRDPPPFPAVDQILSGAPEESVTGKFGDPAISALTSSGGHMLGTYVYARDGGRVATVIHLEDGIVASTTSKSSTPPATGLSVPRRKRPE